MGLKGGVGGLKDGENDSLQPVWQYLCGTAKREISEKRVHDGREKEGLCAQYHQPERLGVKDRGEK